MRECRTLFVSLCLATMHHLFDNTGMVHGRHPCFILQRKKEQKMVAKIKAVIVGKVDKISKKTGNPYTVVTFMDNGEPISLMLGDLVNDDAIEIMQTHEMTLDINLGKYMNAKIVDAKRC